MSNNRLETYRTLAASYATETREIIHNRTNNSLEIARLRRELAAAEAREVELANELASTADQHRQVLGIIHSMEDRENAATRARNMPNV